MAAPQISPATGKRQKVQEKKRSIKELKAMREAIDIAFPPQDSLKIQLKGEKWHRYFDEFKLLNKEVTDRQVRIEEIKLEFAQEMGCAVEGVIPKIGQSFFRDMAEREGYVVEPCTYRKAQFQKSTAGE